MLPCFDCLSFLIIWDVLHTHVLHRTGMVVSLNQYVSLRLSSWQQKEEQLFWSLLMPDTCFNYLLWLIKCSHFQDYHTLYWEHFCKRHNFIWSSCFWIHLLYHSLSHCRQLFPLSFCLLFFLIFITELHTYKNILIFHRFTYDILSVPVMARSSLYLGLENTQVNCILLSCLQTLWQPRSHWYLYKYMVLLYDFLIYASIYLTFIYLVS